MSICSYKNALITTSEYRTNLVLRTNTPMVRNCQGGLDLNVKARRDVIPGSRPYHFDEHTHAMPLPGMHRLLSAPVIKLTLL